MGRIWLAGAVALLATSGAVAQEAETAIMLARIQAQLTELKEANERLQAEVDYLRSNALATRKEAAENVIQIDKIPTLENSLRASEWASRIVWKGDLRYRHDTADAEEAVAVRDRHRLRARIGLTAKVNDTVSAVVQIGTDGGSSDPHSMNQDLGNAWTRKPVSIDLAYAEWKPSPTWALQFGKTPMPWLRTSSYFFDGDITPEGTVARFASGPWFASAFGFWASERSAAADSGLFGAQLGVKRAIGPVNWTAAIAYFDWTHVQDEVVTTASGCSANPAFFGGAFGNTTYSAGGCSRLQNDFNDLQLLAQAEFRARGLPVLIYADYMRNTQASALDTAWAVGAQLGRASEPGSWEVGYLYQVVEKDAIFGQFLDSEFGGNLSDIGGSSVRLGYAPSKNWVLNGTYHINTRFKDVGVERDYTRLMLDMNFRF